MKQQFLTALLAFAIAGCASTSEITVQKGPAFGAETKRVVTLSVYDVQAGSVPSDDAALDAYQKYISGEMTSIYGAAIPGGSLVQTAAEKIGLKDKLNQAMSKITQAALAGAQGGSVLDEGAGMALIKIAETLGVDAFCFPFSEGGYSTIKSGQPISVGVALFDVRTRSLQYSGKITSISVSNMVLMGMQGDDAKIKPVAISLITKSGRALMDQIRTELKP